MVKKGETEHIEGMQIFVKMENQGCLITAVLSFGVEQFLQERNILRDFAYLPGVYFCYIIQ